MNFWTHEEYIEDFEGSLDVDILTLYSKKSTIFYK